MKKLTMALAVLAVILAVHSAAYTQGKNSLPVCGGITYDSSNPTHVLGTNKDDVFNSSASSVGRVIFGLNGDDTLVGSEGDDVICGGNGSDNIAGVGGNDRVFGDNGDDLVSGGRDKDEIHGGNGDDILQGATGSGDSLFGERGDDRIGGGGDFCDGGPGNDVNVRECEIAVNFP
jgi:Ca2+-binding RTX toxin-like protein